MEKKYGRMLEKSGPPEEADIKAYIGAEAADRLEKLENFLSTRYDLSKALVFPFGKSYGWSYKYSHKKKHLCHAFFEQGAFAISFQIGDAIVDEAEEAVKTMLPET